MKRVLAIILFAFGPVVAQAVTIDLVPIGNPGNPSEVQGAANFGRVTTSYQIGKTEVTNAQYVEFLNAKAATDSLGLYNPGMGGLFEGGVIQSGTSGSFTYSIKPNVTGVGPGGDDYTYANKPVMYVSWYDAIRFANWMNNGQRNGSTETGAYTILGGTATPSNADSITRNAGATWFLPSENEWYKAAYYNAATSSYFDYPTGSDSTPDNNLPTADSGNSANFLVGSATTTGDPAYPNTDAGAYSQTHSPYGTFDQSGNVAEWNEALVSAGKRGRRGGGWADTAADLSSATRGSMLAMGENDDTGFRLARTAVSAGVPGDYNSDGVVDAADYVVWRSHVGTSFQLPNEVAGTTPGTVTQEDYTAWRARFGNTSGSGSGLTSGSAVPEPTAAALLMMLAAVFTSARIRRG